MLCESTFKLCPLSLCQRKVSATISNAIPQLLNKRQSLLYAEPIDSKRFK